MTKFAASDVDAIRHHYLEHGYVVVSRLLDPEQIDAFLDTYRQVKSHPLFAFYSQSIHRVIRPQLNSHGFITESMENPSRLGLFPQFSRAVKRCIYDARVSDMLTAIDGVREHVSWQDMFFDLSTGTIDHADSWYLDTDPPGRLIAGWFALEDIAPSAGTFFVMPGSHRQKALDKDDYPDHEEFRRATLQMIERHGFKAQGMPLAKGDVLFWHPFTIHGAFSNLDPRRSRKSFTSHYFPAGTQTRPQVPQIEPTDNPRLQRMKLRSDVQQHLAWYLSMAKDWLLQRRAPDTDMRRSAYR
ncbi:MAG TPA: phytanoyl-CoA dioxygenase family protein [Burkholderiaceae bacterium]|nr:phytanoyl-CoA dioxygenase family protein [Burkholderiaceae bacterium]